MFSIWSTGCWKKVFFFFRSCKTSYIQYLPWVRFLEHLTFTNPVQPARFKKSRSLSRWSSAKTRLRNKMMPLKKHFVGFHARRNGFCGATANRLSCFKSSHDDLIRSYLLTKQYHYIALHIILVCSHITRLGLSARYLHCLRRRTTGAKISHGLWGWC